uniref:RING-type E3 ubiquitin transferase n=1 Tax=Solanum chacoense TaxID=4108 RepID=A0A0V0HZ86_SOLCH
MSTTIATPPQRHHTFWCHECDMSVFLLHPTPNNPRCPHCHSDFLEHMDSITPTILPQFPNHPNPTSDIETPTTFTPSDDNFLLNSPYLHRLIRHLTTTNDAPTPNPHNNSASRSAVAALELLQITSSMLENDPDIPCAVCKDQFLLDMQVKMLPCKHMYHSDCILPWLEMNNSCPVCRFQLPTEEDEVCRRRQNFVAAMRLEEFLGEQEDLFGFRRTLRRVARRHHLDREDTTRGDSLEFLLSPTQIGQTGQGDGVVARANSVETVSSSPNWPPESGSEDEVGGSGNTYGG